MTKITREQINTINAKMHNGFCLDLRTLATWGEKTAAKAIKIDDNTTLIATLEYRASYQQQMTAYRQTYNVPNGLHHIALHIAVWHTREGSSVATSHGLGQWIRVSEDMPRKVFARIQQLTAQYDDATIMALYDPAQHDGGRLYAC